MRHELKSKDWAEVLLLWVYSTEPLDSVMGLRLAKRGKEGSKLVNTKSGTMNALQETRC